MVWQGGQGPNRRGQDTCFHFFRDVHSPLARVHDPRFTVPVLPRHQIGRLSRGGAGTPISSSKPSPSQRLILSFLSPCILAIRAPLSIRHPRTCPHPRSRARSYFSSVACANTSFTCNWPPRAPRVRALQVQNAGRAHACTAHSSPCFPLYRRIRTERRSRTRAARRWSH